MLLLRNTKFDPDAKWIPELADVPASDIHKWEGRWEQWEIDYPGPIIEKKKAIDKFKGLNQSSIFKI